MATFSITNTGRVLSAASLTVLISACSLGRNEPVQIVQEPDTTVQQRFNAEGETSYTAVVPRAPLSSSQLEDDAPNSYTVVRGDTLWDISDRFLKEPWLWPTIWEYNPQIENPDLIYPGDEVALEYVDGQPTLIITRDGKRVTGNNVDGHGSNSVGGSSANASGTRTRLSPRIREESLDDAIPTIPADAINSFLVHPKVVDSKTLRSAPYVVGNFDGRLTSAVGHQIYVRGDLNREQPKYGIYRKSKALRNPESGKILGHEVTMVAEAKLMHTGDPATLVITSNKMETIAGDVLLPAGSESMAHTYTPRMPVLNGEAKIISLVGAISQSGRNQVVVINLGTSSGMQVGDVLAVETRGGSFIDPRGRGGYERIKMPSTRTGVVMVFKSFDEVSYALVMESTLPVKLHDAITGI
ncbi:MAG: LysM peptidoglycan-binding domain-containing protein [Granulosicoccaceae bacterium]